MNTTRCAPAEIVSTRTTFDGVTVHLHADGSISDRCRFLLGGRLPADRMWRVWGDICTYTHAELPEMIRSVKRGTFVPVRIRPNVDAEAVFASQVRRHVCVVNGVIMPVNR